ncbi:hypothetical protein [uncultured Gimesia sp.]|nr:hypothetical protein [uncultured Gimesia sp.]
MNVVKRLSYDPLHSYTPMGSFSTTKVTKDTKKLVRDMISQIRG